MIRGEMPRINLSFVLATPPLARNQLVCPLGLDMAETQRVSLSCYPAVDRACSAREGVADSPFHRLASGLKLDSPRSTDDGFLNPAGAWSIAP